MLSTAAHVDAIITVSAGPVPISTHSASEARIADTALRPLASVVRSARAAAVNAILHSAWQQHQQQPQQPSPRIRRCRTGR